MLTDPPDTLEAFAVWVSRASLALRGANSALYMGLTSVEAAVTKWFRMQQLAIAARFVITDLRRKFTRYAGNPKQVNATVARTSLNLNITGLPSAAQQDEHLLVSVSSDVHRDTTWKSDAVYADKELRPDARKIDLAHGRASQRTGFHATHSERPTRLQPTTQPPQTQPPQTQPPQTQQPSDSAAFDALMADSGASAAEPPLVRVTQRANGARTVTLSPLARKLLGLNDPAPTTAPTTAPATKPPTGTPVPDSVFVTASGDRLVVSPEVIAFFAEKGERIDFAKGGFSQAEIDTVSRVIRNDALASREKTREMIIERLQEAGMGEVLDVERGNLEFIPELRAVEKDGIKPAAAADPNAPADAVWFTSAFIRMVAVDDERPLLISNTLVDFGETLYIDRDQYPTYNDEELTELRQKVLSSPVHPGTFCLVGSFIYHHENS